MSATWSMILFGDWGFLEIKLGQNETITMGLCIMWLMSLGKREKEFGTEITYPEEERDVRGPGEKIVKFHLRRAG